MTDSPSPDRASSSAEIPAEFSITAGEAGEALWNWVLGAWDFLTPGERMILRFLHHISARLDTQETAMSELTDQLDAALAQLGTDESGIEAVFAAQQATITSLQNALAASQAGEAADQAELQKALDAVTAANAKLSQLTGIPASTGTDGTGTGTGTGTADAPAADPAAPAEPGTPSDPTDAVTVVGETDASATRDGWSDSTEAAGSPGTLNDGDTNTDGAVPVPAGDTSLPVVVGEQEVDSTGTPTVS